MTLVNCCAVLEKYNRTLYPWRISEVVSNVSIQGYYHHKIEDQLPQSTNVSHYKLMKAYVGVSKNSLDIADLDLDLIQTVTSFGSFIKYVVKSDEKEGSAVGEATNSALSILMSSQRALCMRRVPVRIARQHLTKKDVLYNDIIAFFEKLKVQWSSSEVDGAGVNLIRTLTECLWYIDGHHSVLEKQGCSIPSVFKAFQGYNIPEASKHRKRSINNLSGATLSSIGSSIFGCLQGSYWKSSVFVELQPAVEQLAKSLCSYSDYLLSQSKKMKLTHSAPVPVRQLSDALSVEMFPRSPVCFPSFSSLSESLKQLPPYHHMCLTEHCPEEPRTRYEHIQKLKRGLNIPIVLLTYSPGNNCGNLHFIWKYDDDLNSEVVFQKSLPVVESIKPQLPVYHTRAMRQALFAKFGRVSPSVQPAVLRYFYRDLTGDSSASCNLREAEIDSRVSQVLDMEPEDPQTVIDLRSLNSSVERAKYDVFWDHCSQYLNESIGTAVDDRRHCEVVHLAQAISVRDLRDQVQLRCPEGTLVPSLEWIRLQFCPKTKSAKVASQYTGRLNIKCMVQKRQWRSNHIDCHYAAAIFRYEREFALKFADIVTFACLDDKHRIKVGEPGYPVAAAERGRRVIVRAGAMFEVGDHDFTKFSIIPSVALINEIPDEIAGSWYRGQVIVTLKEGAFEPSSPLRHAAELKELLTVQSMDKPVLCLYTDGGPDHRLTYLSVQVSLICLFLSLDLDYLLAARTAPSNSWRNPVERIMSTLNLGLQSVGLMRKAGSESFEESAARCNSLTDLRKVADRKSEFATEALDSLAPVKVLLSQVFQRLKLKERSVEMGVAASQSDLDGMWQSLSAVFKSGAIPSCDQVTRKSCLQSLPELAQFMSHCCRLRHYFFEIRKCGDISCDICKPVRLPQEVFEQLKPFPDPEPGVDQHYKAFNDIYGTKTSEKYRPSLSKRSKKQRTLPFHGKVQHVRNADLMLECEECGMWRLVYATHKLKSPERKIVEDALNGMSFSCGSPLQDLDDLTAELREKVYVRDLHCHEPIELLYYTAKYDPICIYCGQPEPYKNNKDYPQCMSCQDKPSIGKKK